MDIAYVAAGRLDGFWGNGLGIWDVAAGILIATEAGALVSDFTGDPNCLDGDHFLCAAPKCFKPMLKTIKATSLPIKAYRQIQLPQARVWPYPLG